MYWLCVQYNDDIFIEVITYDYGFICTFGLVSFQNIWCALIMLFLIYRSMTLYVNINFCVPCYINGLCICWCIGCSDVVCSSWGCHVKILRWEWTFIWKCLFTCQWSSEWSNNFLGWGTQTLFISFVVHLKLKCGYHSQNWCFSCFYYMDAIFLEIVPFYFLFKWELWYYESFWDSFLLLYFLDCYHTLI